MNILRLPTAAFFLMTLSILACSPSVMFGDEFLTQVSTGFVGTISPGGTISITNLTGPDGIFVIPLSINDSGQIIEQTGEFASFLYSGGSFTSISVPMASFTLASGINNSGQITGSSTLGPFIYNSGTYTTFSIMGSTNGVGVYGISNTGQIVGSFQVDANTNLEHPAGFIYTSGAVQTYDPSPSGTVFRGINSSGIVVGGTSTGQAFLYDSNSGIETPFSVPGATSTGALAINDNGQVVGQFRDSTNTTRGYLEFGGQFIIVDYPSGPNTVNVNTILTGINDEGQFVGWTFYDRVPEPSTLCLLGVGLFCFAMRFRNKCN
jgi:probable HAF family extracellular repeat protein